MRALYVRNNRLFYLDQTKLPTAEVWKECRSLKEGFRAIQTLQVRGAPLIGVFAAYVITVATCSFSGQRSVFLRQLRNALVYLKEARPTAVNLCWALDRIETVAQKKCICAVPELRRFIYHEACAIDQQDKLLCQKIATHGVRLIRSGDRILTHCNAGSLATAGIGTALGVIYKAHRKFHNITVYADETRPLLQGARLTAWELNKKGIPCTLICDAMAAYLMQQKKIDKVFVGADRIAANGDTANKIGTYSVAIAARYHKVPLYVVAPFSTFDARIPHGAAIPIEQRHPDEVRSFLGKITVAPKKVYAYNPAFDVTPHALISAIVTDRGIMYPPYSKNLKRKLM